MGGLEFPLVRGDWGDYPHYPKINSGFRKKRHSKEELAVESSIETVFFFFYDTYDFINFLSKYGISMNCFF